MLRVAVIGGGAAGCFAAVEIKRLRPDAEVTVFEAGKRPMAKLAVTGGGKCNITNTFGEVRSISDVYPRGGRFISRLFHSFSPQDCCRWWEENGLPLSEQEGGRVFPECMDASRVTGTLSSLMRQRGVNVVCGTAIRDLSMLAGNVILVSVGGGASAFLKTLGEEIVPPVPSLFTFRINDNGLRSMSGLSVKDAVVSIEGTSFKASGDLLVTEWGLSGPAILKLSSYAARHLADCGYRAGLVVNWSGQDDETARSAVSSLVSSNERKMLTAVHPEFIPSRLWKHLSARCGIRDGMRCAEAGARTVSKLASALVCDRYTIDGRAVFKEEFVTCGGVSLRAVSPLTLESRKTPGLFFAGESLDIDGITGGFNLQAAWTTAMVAARGIAESDLSGGIR